MSNVQTDALIVGAGLVGAAQALALAKHDIRSVLIDKITPDVVMKAGYDGRVSAISYASRMVLDYIDIWNNIASDAGAIESIMVTEGNPRSDIAFRAEDVGSEPFGHMVPNHTLRNALLEAAMEHPLINCVFGETIEALDCAAGVSATLNSGKQVSADLLAIADGRYSTIREKMGISARRYTYQQHAIVCTVSHTQPHHNTATEWFFPVGPLALLPMNGGHRSCIVWTEEDALAQHMVQLSDKEFEEELRVKLQGMLGNITIEGQRYAYPLNLFQAEHYTGQNCVVIGDAAHAIHPIAGQGVNLGYRDVAVLTELLVEAKHAGQHYASSALLQRYQQWRSFDASSMVATTDGLNRLFSNPSQAVAFIRNMGMGLFERSHTLKHCFMETAMGMRGDLPKMLQGIRL